MRQSSLICFDEERWTSAPLQLVDWSASSGTCEENNPHHCERMGVSLFKATWLSMLLLSLHNAFKVRVSPGPLLLDILHHVASCYIILHV